MLMTSLKFSCSSKARKLTVDSITKSDIRYQSGNTNSRTKLNIVCIQEMSKKHFNGVYRVWLFFQASSVELISYLTCCAQ